MVLAVLVAPAQDVALADLDSAAVLDAADSDSAVALDVAQADSDLAAEQDGADLGSAAALDAADSDSAVALDVAQADSDLAAEQDAADLDSAAALDVEDLGSVVEPDVVLAVQGVGLVELDVVEPDLDSALVVEGVVEDPILRNDRSILHTACLEGKRSEALDVAVVDEEDVVRRSIRNVECLDQRSFLEGSSLEPVLGVVAQDVVRSACNFRKDPCGVLEDSNVDQDCKRSRSDSSSSRNVFRKDSSLDFRVGGNGCTLDRKLRCNHNDRVQVRSDLGSSRSRIHTHNCRSYERKSCGKHPSGSLVRSCARSILGGIPSSSSRKFRRIRRCTVGEHNDPRMRRTRSSAGSAERAQVRSEKEMDRNNIRTNS